MTLDEVAETARTMTDTDAAARLDGVTLVRDCHGDEWARVGPDRWQHDDLHETTSFGLLALWGPIAVVAAPTISDDMIGRVRAALIDAMPAIRPHGLDTVCRMILEAAFGTPAPEAEGVAA